MHDLFRNTNVVTNLFNTTCCWRELQMRVHIKIVYRMEYWLVDRGRWLVKHHSWLVIDNGRTMHYDWCLVVHEWRTLNHDRSPMDYDVWPMVHLRWRMVDNRWSSDNYRILLRTSLGFFFLCSRELDSFGFWWCCFSFLLLRNFFFIFFFLAFLFLRFLDLGFSKSRKCITFMVESMVTKAVVTEAVMVVVMVVCVVVWMSNKSTSMDHLASNLGILWVCYVCIMGMIQRLVDCRRRLMEHYWRLMVYHCRFMNDN